MRPTVYHTLSSPSSLIWALWISPGTLCRPRFPSLPSLFSLRNHLSTPWLLTHHCAVESFLPDPRRRKRWAPGQFSSSSKAVVFPSNPSLVLLLTLLFWSLSYPSRLHGWLRSPLMAAGDDSPFAKHLARHLGFRNPLQTPSNIRPSPAAQDDLLTLDIARWFALYPCDMYNTSFGSFEKGRPHLIQPSEERFVLDPIYDLVYWFLECHIHFPHLCF